MVEWRNMDSAPKDREIMLWYENYLGEPAMVVSGHWHEEPGREFEATWVHSYGYGDADMWSELPTGPTNESAEPS